MEPLYFKRYTDIIAETAHALQIITTDQYALIMHFYEKDEFVLRGTDNVDILSRYIPKTKIIRHDSTKDIYFVRVLEWPHLKVMCLKCAPSNPCIWKYFDESEKELFEYRLDTFSILCPPSVLPSDSRDTTGHRLD